MNGPTWNKSFPTHPGWYWVRRLTAETDDHSRDPGVLSKRVIQFYRNGIGAGALHFEPSYLHLLRGNAEFAGPIKDQVEPIPVPENLQSESE